MTVQHNEREDDSNGNKVWDSIPFTSIGHITSQMSRSREKQREGKMYGTAAIACDLHLRLKFSWLHWEQNLYPKANQQPTTLLLDLTPGPWKHL